MNHPNQLNFDTIIVGAGSAGCLLANRLSKDPNHRVLLIEAGGEDDWFWIKIPIGYLFTIANPRTDWCFKTEPEPGLNGRSINYPRGRVLGGSSSINGMLYMRGQSGDYDHWAKVTGDNTWNWQNALSIHKSIENYFDGENEWHGSKGEIRVEEPRVKWKILDAWQQAASEQEIPTIPEFNRGDNFGCAYFHMNQKKGVRWSMADAFLHPIRNRKNLTLMTKTQVLKVLTKNISDTTRNQSRYQTKAWANSKHEVYGLEILNQNSKKIVTANNEVILSAGSVSSPHLLQISGIGSSSHLKSIGVDPICDLKGVGENLQDHLQIRSVYKVSNCRTVNTLYKNFITRIGMALQ
ncbi:MAG: GMC family oxidoreductase N-terminal domain-containing protein, partial [Pseudomonadota bacterium]